MIITTIAKNNIAN